MAFDQLPFGMTDASSKDMAFARTGYAYVPPRCRRDTGSNGSSTPCRLHVFFHGCGSAFNSGSAVAGHGFNFTCIAHAGFSAWGEENDIVILFPQKDASKETCWDGYMDGVVRCGRPNVVGKWQQYGGSPATSQAS